MRMGDKFFEVPAIALPIIQDGLKILRDFFSQPNLALDSFFEVWSQNDGGALHKCCPEKADAESFFHLQCTCFLSLLNLPIESSEHCVNKGPSILSHITSFAAKQAVWNIGVLYLTFSFYWSQKNDLKIPIRLHHGMFSELVESFKRIRTLGDMCSDAQMVLALMMTGDAFVIVSSNPFNTCSWMSYHHLSTEITKVLLKSVVGKRQLLRECASHTVTMCSHIASENTRILVDGGEALRNEVSRYFHARSDSSDGHQGVAVRPKPNFISLLFSFSFL